MAGENPPEDPTRPRLIREPVLATAVPPPRDVPPLTSDADAVSIGKATAAESYGSSAYGSGPYGGNRQVYEQPPFTGGPADNVINSRRRPGPGPLPGATSNASFDAIEPVKPPETTLPPPPPHFGPEPDLRVGGAVAIEGGAVAHVSAPGKPTHDVLHAAPLTVGDHRINLRPAAGRPVITGTADMQLVGLINTATGTVTGKPKRKRTVLIRNKTQVIREAGLLIVALDDALGYRARDRGNALPPELWRQLNLEDPELFALISRLVEELKKLNAFLESDRKKGSNAKIVAELQKVGLKVLSRYGTTVAVGAGLLTIGMLCTLLQHVGLGEVVDNTLIWTKIGH